MQKVALSRPLGTTDAAHKDWTKSALTEIERASNIPDRASETINNSSVVGDTVKDALETLDAAIGSAAITALTATVTTLTATVATADIGYIFGLTLSNGTDATNDIDIATGTAASAAGVLMTLAASLTKQLDAAWAVGTNAGGLDTGAIADGTYHVWLIQRSDTSVVDALFSTSATAPNMPANYDRKRRIGSILRETAAIVPFTQYGDLFVRSIPIADVSTNGPGTARVTATLSVPTGIVATALVAVTLRDETPATATNLLITSLVEADSVATNFRDLSIGAVGAAVPQRTSGDFYRLTNTSAQISYRQDNSSADHTTYIVTRGWLDSRGHDA